jgi:outer membrane receptor protein involved in Fe transport
MKIRFCLAAILAGFLLCLSFSLHAEVDSEACSETQQSDYPCNEIPVELGKIVVTAMRRETAVERVPGGISVLSGDRLQEMGASSFTDYARTVPGLSFTSAGGFGGEKYVIRGISTDTASEYRATTAVYFDETPITDGGHSGMTYSPDPLLVDIARVEVLRGPQGALFGSGSMGGAIRIISKQPDPFVTEGFAEAILNTVNHGGFGYDLRAMVNAPFANNDAAFRAVAYYRDLDGWIDNTTLDQKNVNNNETKGLRLAANWLVHDRWKISGKFVYQDRQSDGTTIDQGNPDWTQQRASAEPNADEWMLANIDIEYAFDWGDFISTTSWHERDVDTRSDVTEFFGHWTTTAVNQDDLDEFTQEFRLASSGENRLQWLTGFFYQDQEYFFGQDFPSPGFDEATGGLASEFGHPDNVYVGRTWRTIEQIALFGDLSWSFSDQWDGEIGGRWFRYDHTSLFITDGLYSFGYFEEYLEGDEDGFIPRASLTYEHSDQLNLYGLVSGGYRPGGLNEASASNFPECQEDLAKLGLDRIPKTFESDSLWNYELGLKSNFADRKVYFNAAIYYMDWSDIQTMYFMECGAAFYWNAGKATSKGAEFELAAYPVSNLELTFNGSYTNATLGEDAPNYDALKGTKLPGVPERTLGGSLSWFFDAFENATTWLRLDYQYVGSSWNAISQSYRTKVPSYSLTHFRMGYNRGQWEASLFVNNLFDERAIINIYDNFAGQYVTTARPRTFGGSLRFNF